MKLYVDCDTSTPFAKILSSKNAFSKWRMTTKKSVEVLWTLNDSLPLGETSQKAAFMTAVGLDATNASKLALGRTLFLISSDRSVNYDINKSPSEVGLKDGQRVRMSLNRAFFVEPAAVATPDVSAQAPKLVQAPAANPQPPYRAPAVVAAVATPSKVKRTECTSEALRDEGNGDYGAPRMDPAHDWQSQSPPTFRSAGASVNTLAVGDDQAAAALRISLVNIDEYLAHIGNSKMTGSLGGMMDNLNTTLALQHQKEFETEEAAIRLELAQRKLDNMIVHICRRQVLKMQQVQQLLYERAVLVKLHQQRRAPGGTQGENGEEECLPVYHLSTAGAHGGSGGYFDYTALGEQLSRTYLPSVLDAM